MYLEIANRHMKDFYNMELVAPFEGKSWPRPYKIRKYVEKWRTGL